MLGWTQNAQDAFQTVSSKYASGRSTNISTDSSGTRDPSKDHSPELSSQVPLPGSFPPACPSCFAPQPPGRGQQLIHTKKKPSLIQQEDFYLSNSSQPFHLHVLLRPISSRTPPKTPPLTPQSLTGPLTSFRPNRSASEFAPSPSPFNAITSTSFAHFPVTSSKPSLSSSVNGLLPKKKKAETKASLLTATDGRSKHFHTVISFKSEAQSVHTPSRNFAHEEET